MEEKEQTVSADWQRMGRVLMWGGLVALGARKGGLLGILAMGYGIERLSGIALGKSIGVHLLEAAAATPRHRFGDGTRDVVDEASWESFPASDPPARGIG